MKIRKEEMKRWDVLRDQRVIAQEKFCVILKRQRMLNRFITFTCLCNFVKRFKYNFDRRKDLIYRQLKITYCIMRMYLVYKRRIQVEYGGKPISHRFALYIKNCLSVQVGMMNQTKVIDRRA